MQFSFCISDMNYYPLFMVKSWNSGMRCMSLSILINSWYGQIVSWDIRVLVVFAPNLTLCHRHAALLPCWVHYWWLTPSIYVFTSIIFRRCVSCRRVSPLCEHKARSLCQGLCTPHAGFPPHEKTKIELGVTRHSTWAKWGGIWTDAWVCLCYWVVIWVAGYSNSP